MRQTNARRSVITRLSCCAPLIPIITLILTGCGGGGGSSEAPPQPPSAGPVIVAFDSDKSDYFVGETAMLTATFSGGTGRIEPDVGAVQSDVAVATGPLDLTQRYRLIVTSAGQSAERELELNVSFRDRYKVFDQPFRSARHTATLLPDGRIAVVGGSRGQSAISNSIDLFDPASESFTNLAGMATGRENHTATLLPGDRLLVIGGNAGLAQLVPADLVELSTGVVTASGTSTAERLDHTATLLADGDVLVVGGISNEGRPFGVSDSAELWDAETGQFQRLPERLNYPRAGHTATRLADGRVLIVGGVAIGVPYVFAEIFDPSTRSFSIIPSSQVGAVSLHAAVEQSDGSVLILGGESDTESLDTVYRYDPVSETFQQAPGLGRPRSLHEAVRLRDDSVLLFGGESLALGQRVGAAEGYRAATGSMDIQPMPAGRAWHTATRLEDGRVLILGGESQSGALISDVLIYD